MVANGSGAGLAWVTPISKVRRTSAYIGLKVDLFPIVHSPSLNIIMESIFDVQALPFRMGSLIAGALLLLSILRQLAFPPQRHNRAKVLRIGKTGVQSWITWDSAPQLSLGKYVKEGYYKVRRAHPTPLQSANLLRR